MMFNFLSIMYYYINIIGIIIIIALGTQFPRAKRLIQIVKLDVCLG